MTITLLENKPEKAQRFLLKKLFFNKFISYLCVFSIVFSNVAWAGKDIFDDVDASKPLVSVRPSNYLSAGIDEITLYGDENVTFHKNISGDVFLLPYSPHSIKKAVSSGQDNLEKFIASHFFTVRGNADDVYAVSFTPRMLGGIFGGGGKSSERPILSGQSSHPGDTGGKYNTSTGRVIEPVRITVTPGHTDWSSTSPSYGGYNKDPLDSHGGEYYPSNTPSSTSKNYTPDEDKRLAYTSLQNAISGHPMPHAVSSALAAYLLEKGLKHDLFLSPIYKFTYHANKMVWEEDHPFKTVFYAKSIASIDQKAESLAQKIFVDEKLKALPGLANWTGRNEYGHNIDRQSVKALVDIGYIRPSAKGRDLVFSLIESQERRSRCHLVM